MINVGFDCETADPDDMFTLCILAHHPKVNLVCVTVTPGSKHQIGLVKHILKLLGKNIPVGSKNADHSKECVSEFHYNWLGKIPPAEPDDIACNILEEMILLYPDLTIICGGPLGNIGALLDKNVKIKRLFIQGGFAGDNIVSIENVLGKFRGMITCPTFNLNGDVKSALKILESNNILQRWFISKNVCHSSLVKYEKDMHKFMQPYTINNVGLKLLYNGMDKYLSNKREGKSFHDPLAACCAINQSVCKFQEVELYREKGEWGSRKSDNINCKISIQVDPIKFRNVMVGVE